MVNDNFELFLLNNWLLQRQMFILGLASDGTLKDKP